MRQRFDINSVSSGGLKAMLGLNAHVKNCGLEASLLELVKIRVSQLNGCAFCIAMHVADARKLGVSEERMHLLAAWREAPIYSPRERAALAWAEALARLVDGDVPDAVFEEASRHFSAAETADLAYAVVEIGGWNRLMIASRTPPAVAASGGA
jgi:AhpD family alkylhydroperoxidase